jgi:hypothetical protein
MDALVGQTFQSVRLLQHSERWKTEGQAGMPVLHNGPDTNHRRRRGFVRTGD